MLEEPEDERFLAFVNCLKWRSKPTICEINVRILMTRVGYERSEEVEEGMRMVRQVKEEVERKTGERRNKPQWERMRDVGME